MLAQRPPCTASSLEVVERSDAFSLDYRISSDINEQANSISGWEQNYDQLSAGHFWGCTLDLCFNNLQLFRETTHQHLYQSGSARPGCCVFGIPIAMAGRAVFSGQTLDCNRLIVLQEGDTLDFCTPRYFDVIALVLPSESLKTFAAQVEGVDLTPILQGDAVRSPNLALLDSLRTCALDLLNRIHAAPHQLNHPNLRHTLSQGLFLHVLTVLENPETAAAPPLLPLSRRRVVERAKTYLHEHIDEPVTIADLCIALNVSRRTLQYSFQDVLDINPVRYLKAIRLNHVRRELMAKSTAEVTVGDVATKWGFWHVGRFSTEYRQMFGELPSATLRNSM